ncbi:MAG TPA: hypothetical protein VE175_07150 [Woeseiaceae bacterium]|jgi:hypothetical protein|nr:hypothetical protein [Woeseiaceae bacterium]
MSVYSRGSKAMRDVFRMILMGAVLAGSLASAADSPSALPAAALRTSFARIARDEYGGPLALQTAIVTYAPAAAPQDFTVDLIGAVHVADRAYYQDLNERFRDYDALLFEMVVRDKAQALPEVGSATGGTSFISVVQNGMKDVLGLSYQLDEIDYTARNFVHADLSSAMLLQSMSDRGESLYTYFWRLVFNALDEYAKDPMGTQDWRLLSGLVASGNDDALKVVVAEELIASMNSDDVFGGENGSAIIAARNEHAFGVLAQQIDGGAKHIGIFYGVAHMADFEERLLNDLRLEKTQTRWLDAWRFARSERQTEN